MDVGVDMMNMAQPQVYGIHELGARFAGKMAFLTTCDIQTTLPGGDRNAIAAEAEELIRNWTTPQGGMVVFNYGMGNAIGVNEDMTRFMFKEFDKRKSFWQAKRRP